MLWSLQAFCRDQAHTPVLSSQYSVLLPEVEIRAFTSPWSHTLFGFAFLEA